QWVYAENVARSRIPRVCQDRRFCWLRVAVRITNAGADTADGKDGRRADGGVEPKGAGFSASWIQRIGNHVDQFAAAHTRGFAWKSGDDRFLGVHMHQLHPHVPAEQRMV